MNLVATLASKGWLMAGSLLHSACQGGSVSLVRTLIQKHNADTNAKNDQNNTPLHVAAFSGEAEVALCLINEFGCDPSVKGRFGRSLLHCACERRQCQSSSDFDSRIQS